MEADTAGWSHYFVDPDFRDDWRISDYRNHTPGGTYSWKCGGDSSSPYGSFLDAALETPELPIGVRTELRFFHWMEAESSSFAGECYDGGILEICQDGVEWTQIEPIGGYPYISRGGQFSPFEAGTPCFSGSFDWEQAVFDLSPYTGTAAIRFRFGTNQNMNLEGWYVDDVWVGEVARIEEFSGLESERILRLAPNVPNPFRGGTQIAYSLPEMGPVNLSVFDVTGRLVQVIDRGVRDAGMHVVEWNGRDSKGLTSPSGVYFCRLLSGTSSLTRKMLLLK
jgi:hypothetical protein